MKGEGGHGYKKIITEMFLLPCINIIHQYIDAQSDLLHTLSLSFSPSLSLSSKQTDTHTHTHTQTTH